ncbi:N-acetylmannosamine-6-phosphate 2-epimerase [Bacillus sp. FJAT-18017]|uniref:N-acetylmannosamine-6-phosphate 2-epimerase n=1 Tax=Bacillus sp. FJAT-18017 TaxID=1705566 RepID=UPI0006B033EB|nr:N-acetylmannosamine-6-phosphate 2-epimerase [Bacillus sp. FJAT-18017]ALC89100.1 N-acetylmannosamine-6-phosphate 2-epimerase [Bacillus sp. FJAT-18017]
MNNKTKIFDQLKGNLIVSCQALPEEPLHSPYIMGRMAYAAKLGGAKGIRANSVEDIREIKKTVDLPIIGIIKRDYDGSDVFITPTIEEIDSLYQEGVDIIALDATNRIRPDGKTIEEVFPILKEKYKDQLFMADCSTFEEGKKAYELGFDCVGSTLSGYTAYTRGKTLPDTGMLRKLASELPVPVIAEGGIWTPEELKTVFEVGVHTAVVGTAITRPMEITKRFVNAIQ